MLDVFESNLIANRLLDEGQGLVLGVSGGPDSMAMLDMFLQIREKWGLSLFVVHINHGFRGALAERDAKSVEAFCLKNDVPFYRFDYDVMKLSQAWGMSFEEAGRKVRYEAFESVLKKVGAHKIAVAQNKNDQAETILMRLMRGTGIEGLKGIPVRRGQHIIRPVLFMSREEIEAYCSTNQVPVCHDHTNDETVYTRNKIRHELLPYIEQNFNGQIVEGLYRLGALLSQDVAYIETTLDEILKKEGLDICCASEVQTDWFNQLHEALKPRLVRRIIKCKGLGLKDVTYAQIDEVLHLVESGRHGKRKIISGIEFSVKYDTLYFQRKDEVNSNSESSEEVKPAGTFELRELALEDYKEYALKRNEASVDLEKINGDVSVRFRLDGDKFQPMGMKGTKKLKKFFIDLKIPAEIRDQVPLICDESGIIWVVGYRLSERVKVDQSTRRVGIINWSDSC